VPDGHIYTTPPSNHVLLHDGLRQALDLIVHGDPHVMATTLRTLLLGFEATAIAAAVGLPLGCLLAIGRFRGRRGLLALASALTKVPPVVVGAVVLVLVREESPWGGGPLAAFGNSPHFGKTNIAQTLLVFPIIVALTATALQTVAPGLLEQARAYGAPGWRRGLLALREARAAVLAGVILALGVALTAIGAIAVAGGGIGNANNNEPYTLATGTLSSFNQSYDTYRGEPLAVAYATILLGLFLLLAAGATALQRSRGGWIAGSAA
jgi:tungstate transport system permease protein